MESYKRKTKRAEEKSRSKDLRGSFFSFNADFGFVYFHSAFTKNVLSV